MRLPEFCIQRPVFTIVMSLVLIVFGVIGYMQLSVRQLPNIDRPVVTIMTTYTGASPSLVERAVTTPIENALSGISGVDSMHSRSEQGSSRVVIRFTLETDINTAVSDVLNKLAGITRVLPKDVDAPIVRKSDPDAVQSIVLSVADEKLSPMALTDYVQQHIVPSLEQIDGVGEVQVFGARSYAMRVWLDPLKLAMRRVAVSDVASALTDQSRDVPGGQIKSLHRDYNVRAQLKLNAPAAFNDFIIRDDSGSLVRLSDVGSAEVGPKDTDSAMRFNGKPAVGIAIIAQANANPVQVADRIAAEAKQMEGTLPSGMHMRVAFNNSSFVHASLRNVYIAVAEAVLLVLLVVLLSLGSLRSTSIPIVTIPICVIAVFAFLFVMHFSINIVTLLALVLSIGLVVDDAIVMLENNYRHIEGGMAPKSASIKGSREITFAIIAMTITLAAVYAPIAFLPGATGRIFKEFAFTLAGTVIISGFVALTLSPMMCAHVLRPRSQHSAYNNLLDRFFAHLHAGYGRLLRFVLHHRGSVVFVLILLVSFGVFAFRALPAGLVTAEDQGLILSIIEPPTDANFDYMNKFSLRAEKFLKQIPEVESYLSWTNTDRTMLWAVLRPWSERSRSQMQIANQLRKEMRNLVGVRAAPVTLTSFSHSIHGNALGIDIMTTGSYVKLEQLIKRLKNAVSKNPGLTDVRSDLKFDSQQFDVTIDRDMASILGVNVSDIATTLATMMGGNQVSTFNVGNQSYPVIVEMRDVSRRNLSAINHLYVRSQTGKMIPLSSVVRIKSEAGATELLHRDRLRSGTLWAELAPNYPLPTAVQFFKQTASTLLPDNAHYAFTGAARRYLQSRYTMALSFGLALLFIYLVLSAQFESFVDPWIILLSVPLAMVGALLTLWAVGGTMDIFAEIGMVTLIGLIAKHGILITEFTNQLRAKGQALEDALVEAATLRLRPILMTTAAMAIGALPLALASGAGAISRQHIGWVIVGGLLFGTFFSLIVVPVAYSYLGQHKRVHELSTDVS